MLHIEIPTPILLRNSIFSAIFLVFCYSFPFTSTPQLTEGFCIEEPPRITQGVLGPPLKTPPTPKKVKKVKKVVPAKPKVSPTPVLKNPTPKKTAPPKKVERIKTRHTDYQGVIWFLKSHEKFSPKAFWDFNQNTYSWGSKAPNKNATITLKEGNKLFQNEINKRYVFILKNYPNLKDDRVVALVLTNLVFNLGYDGFGKNLKKAIKNYDPKNRASRVRLCTWIKKYNRAGGKVLQGLVKRRNGEAELIMASESERQILFEKYRKIVSKELAKHKNH